MTTGNDNIIPGDGHVLDALSVYIDGAMEPDKQEQVRTHIAKCEDCRAEYLEMHATKQMLAALPTIAPPRAFTLTQEMVAPRTSFWQRIFVPRYAPRFATGSALAFGLLVLILISDLGLMGQYRANAPAAFVPGPVSDAKFVEPDSTATAAWNQYGHQYGIVGTPPVAMVPATAAAADANMASPAAGGSGAAANEAPEATGTSGATTSAGVPPTDLKVEESATLSAQQTADSHIAVPMQGSRQQSEESYPALVPRAESKQSNRDSYTVFTADSGRQVLTALEVALALLAAGLMVGALLARKSRA